MVCHLCAIPYVTHTKALEVTDDIIVDLKDKISRLTDLMSHWDTQLNSVKKRQDDSEQWQARVEKSMSDLAARRVATQDDIIDLRKIIQSSAFDHETEEQPENKCQRIHVPIQAVSLWNALRGALNFDSGQTNRKHPPQ